MDVAQNIQPDSFNNILVRDSYGNFSFFDIGLLEPTFRTPFRNYLIF